MRFHLKASSTQGGGVLVVSLLLLLVMTVLALGASQSTRMQERMAGSLRNHELAFQSAEAGLRAAERWIDDPARTIAPNACISAPCRVWELGALTTVLGLTYYDQAYQSQAWWDEKAWAYAATPTISGTELASAEPQYYIEEVEEVFDSYDVPQAGPPPSRIYYRITSRARGATDSAQVVLQSTFSRRFN